MKTMAHEKTRKHKTVRAASPGSSDKADRAGILHERAVLSARLTHLLRGSLRGLDWPGLAEADRNSLERALTALGGDIPLLWLIRSQAASGAEGAAHGPGGARSGATENEDDTAKAAPAASPSREGIESSDGLRPCMIRRRWWGILSESPAALLPIWLRADLDSRGKKAHGTPYHR